MLQRISDSQDLYINLEINLQNVHSVTIDYYTDEQYKHTVVLDVTIDKQIVYIPSTALKQMNEGQLKSKIHYNYTNGNLPDGLQDTIVNQNFAVWIYKDTNTQGQ